eukprot:677354-Pleurochrysis_carterae.AAC.4
MQVKHARVRGRAPTGPVRKCEGNHVPIRCAVARSKEQHAVCVFVQLNALLDAYGECGKPKTINHEQSRAGDPKQGQRMRSFEVTE